MSIKKRGLVFSLSIIVLILFLNLAYAADTNTTSLEYEKQASACINESRVIMNELVTSGFNILSVNDSIKQADLAFNSQVLLRETKKNYDFSIVIPYCDNIQTIRNTAIIARDDFSSLSKFYNETVVSGMDATEIDATMAEIKRAIEEERYSEVSALVNEAYNEISESRASNTAINLIYKATATGFKNFFLAKNRIFQLPNWQVFSGIAVILLVLFLVYRTSIRKRMLNNKMEQLKNKKKTIKDLIMKTQKDYFQTGKIPEGEYNIKTKSYSEIIRDIDRQIPLLQEELAKIEGSKKKTTKR